MDNFYTTMTVVKKLYEDYKWTSAGTVVTTKKKIDARTVGDFPFLKLSNGAVAMVERGWWCRATQTIKHGLLSIFHAIASCVSFAYTEKPAGSLMVLLQQNQPLETAQENMKH